MALEIRFRFRPFVSVLTGFSFLAVVLSGIALFVSPQGRIANWSNWTFWGLTKHQWSDLHICFSAVLLVISIFHLWLNRKPLFSYFVARIKAVAKFRTEWIAAGILCAIVWWGSLNPFVPFSSLLALGENFKLNQPVTDTQPPVPHAELLTIEELAAQANTEIETVLENLQSNGIDASEMDVFGDVAEQTGLPPDELYQIAMGQSMETRQDGQRHRGGAEGGSGGGGGGGFGQNTLTEACEELGLTEQEALELLKSAGIDASLQQTIRSIADENNIHPSEIRQILQER